MAFIRRRYLVPPGRSSGKDCCSELGHRATAPEAPRRPIPNLLRWGGGGAPDEPMRVPRSEAAPRGSGVRHKSWRDLCRTALASTWAVFESSRLPCFPGLADFLFHVQTTKPCKSRSQDWEVPTEWGEKPPKSRLVHGTLVRLLGELVDSAAHLVQRAIFGVAVALLQRTHELVLVTIDALHVVVGQVPPPFLDLAAQLFPLAFEYVVRHFSSSR